MPRVRGPSLPPPDPSHRRETQPRKEGGLLEAPSVIISPDHAYERLLRLINPQMSSCLESPIAGTPSEFVQKIDADSIVNRILTAQPVGLDELIGVIHSPEGSRLLNALWRRRSETRGMKAPETVFLLGKLQPGPASFQAAEIEVSSKRRSLHEGQFSFQLRRDSKGLYPIHGIESKARRMPLTPQTSTILRKMAEANAHFLKRHPKQYYEALVQTQTPVATVITCCDSRIQMTALHKDAIGELFIIRHIGNQVVTNKGSLAYGIKELKTPFLIIIGHSACGAIRAAMGDYDHLDPDIQDVLKTIPLPFGKRDPNNNRLWTYYAVENVHHQVALAMERYAGIIQTGALTVVGALYDLRNDFGLGYGRLVINNINGVREETALWQSPLLKGVKGVHVKEFVSNTEDSYGIQEAESGPSILRTGDADGSTPRNSLRNELGAKALFQGGINMMGFHLASRSSASLATTMPAFRPLPRRSSRRLTPQQARWLRAQGPGRHHWESRHRSSNSYFPSLNASCGFSSSILSRSGSNFLSLLKTAR